MARIFLETGETFPMAASDSEIRVGSGGTENVILQAGASGNTLDGDIEQFDFATSASQTTLQVTNSGRLEVTSGGNVLGTFDAGLSGELDLRFTDGNVTLSQTGGGRFELANPADPGDTATVTQSSSQSATSVTLGSEKSAAGGDNTNSTPGTVSVDASGSDDSGNDSLEDASSNAVTFDFADPATANVTYQIDKFSGDDTLNFVDVQGSSAADFDVLADGDQGDGNQDIRVTNTNTGNSLTVTLTGLSDSQDGNVFNQSSFENAFGANSLVLTGDSQPPTIESGQTLSFQENAPAQADIGQIAASDDGSISSLAITSAPGDLANYVNIAADGTVTLTQAGAGSALNDFETGNNSFTATVQATDNDGNTASADVTFDVTDDTADNGSLPALPGDGGPDTVDRGTSTSENINGNQTGSVSGNGGRDRFIFDTGSSADLTIDDFDDGDQLFFNVDSPSDISIGNTDFSDGQVTLSAGQADVTITNLSATADAESIDATSFANQFAGDAVNTGTLESTGTAALDVQFTDPDGVFNGAQAQLRNTMEKAWTNWTDHFNLNATSTIEAELESIPEQSDSGILAQAKSIDRVRIDKTHDGQEVLQQGVVSELKTGNDPNGSTPDLNIQIPTLSDWQFARDESGSIDPERLDAQTILTHEIGHALGFNSRIDFDPSFANTFDTNVETSSGNGFVFDGPTARSVNGGQPVDLTDNKPVHLTDSDALMSPFLGRGDVREVSDVELAILEDSGVPVSDDVFAMA